MWYNWRAIIGCAGPNFRKVKSFKKIFHDFVQRTQACHFPKPRPSDSGTGNPHMRSHRSQKWHSARERPSLPKAPPIGNFLPQKCSSDPDPCFPQYRISIYPKIAPMRQIYQKLLTKIKFYDIIYM